MDNITHSLIGAVLGQAGLKRKSGLGMPTLIIAANIPDIDATCAALGTVSLAMRRGITHGPIAILLLPLLLTGAMVWFDRWQARRGTRPESRMPVRPGWLLALAYIGCLSHPLFDWMNSYGIRLLEPFSHRWFYGDALFIVDPWLLAMLIAGVWLSRRREKGQKLDWTNPARIAIVGATAFVLLNIGISAYLGERAQRGWDQRHPPRIVTNPVPIAFWRRNILWRTDDYYGSYELSLFGEKNRAFRRMPTGLYFVAHVANNRTKDNPEARAFLFWSRLPVAEYVDDFIVLRDQRFMDSMTSSQFQVRVKP